MKNFNVIIVGIAADGLKKEFLGLRIGLTFMDRMQSLNVSPIGEGGEFETFVLDCPLFQKELEVVGKDISGEKHAWRMDIEVRLEEKKN